MTHQFKQGQLILARFKTKGDVRYLWNVQRYMAEDEKNIFLLGGYLFKEGYEFLPFEGNEHLLGTRNDPAPKWEPKPGELVAVSKSGMEWLAQIFMRKENGKFLAKYSKDSVAYDLYKLCDPLHKHFNVPKE